LKTRKPTQAKSARKPSDALIAKRYLDLQKTSRRGPQSRINSCNIGAFSSRGHFPRQCYTDSAGLTMEETIEFEALDALPPFDDSGNIAWSFEGGPMTRREKRWLELYLKDRS
jgi:hypothetical protein